jgi:DNA-binding transcriptional LysR family regulator
MKINSYNLEAFFKLSQERNFTRAAKDMGLSQPAFSQRIMALENELETTLVIRDKQSIQLTEAGEKLLRYCMMNAQLENEFLSDILTTSGSSQELAGQIRVCGFSSVMRSLLVPSFANVLNANPKLSLQTFTAELEAIPSYLFTARADLILVNKPIQKEGLKSELLGYEENVLVRSGKAKELEIYLDHDPNDTTTSFYFDLLRRKPPQNKRYLDDVYGLLDGVKLGLGKAVLPVHLLKNEKELVIENPKIKLKVPVYLVYYDSPYYTKTQSVAMDAIRSFFQVKLSH